MSSSNSMNVRKLTQTPRGASWAVARRDTHSSEKADGPRTRAARYVCFAGFALQRRFAAAIVADADGFFHLRDEDLTIADGARAHGLDQRVDYFLLARVGHHHF